MFIAMRKRPEEREEGFTLIELLVVVIIIGILAAIAIPTFLNQRQRGWQAELTSDVRNAALDLEAEGTITGGTYPDALAADISGQYPNTAFTYTTDGDEFCLVGERDGDAAGDLPGGVLFENTTGGVGGMGQYAETLPSCTDFNA